MAVTVLYVPTSLYLALTVLHEPSSLNLVLTVLNVPSSQIKRNQMGRSAREKIHQSEVAHILNDETQRK